MVFARVQDVLPETQGALSEKEGALSVAHGALPEAEGVTPCVQGKVEKEPVANRDDLKTVEPHGDEQKSHLTATVNPLPGAPSVEVMFCDETETMHALEQDSSSWRLGLAVTKKTGCAVQRNRVKRVLREFFRLHQHDLPEHVDIVVVPKKHLRPSRVGLQYVTKELLPLFVDIRRYTMQKSSK